AASFPWPIVVQVISARPRPAEIGWKSTAKMHSVGQTARPAWFTPREGTSLRTSGLASLTPRNGCGAPVSYVRADPAGGVASAGKAGELALAGGVTSRRGLQDDIIVGVPRTPDHLTDVQRRHRQKGGPGELETHWGLKSLKLPDPGEGYGMKSNKGEDVAQNFRSGQMLGVAEYMNSCSEAVFFTTKREPLGKSYLRGHVLPPSVNATDYKGFGKATERSDHTSKDCIFPRGVAPDSVEVRAQYKKTHGNTEPGERIGLDYEYPKAISDNPLFRFGAADPFTDRGGQGFGAKSALTMDGGEIPLGVPKTLLVKDSLAHFQQISGENFASSRHIMQAEGMKHLPPGHSHGKASTSGNHTAGQLIRGMYPVEQQMPDLDLGKCTMVGRRNFETDEPLGVPSVRYDKKAPPHEKRSVANSTNFGDDVSAGTLIKPTRFQFKGVNSEDFQLRRAAPELESILQGAGCRIEQDQLGAIIGRACDLHGDEDDRASLEAVMAAVTEWTQSQN
ncbi:unnamed protein product, partial [Polarella glacialis]